jgi:hypothetical protein
MTARFARGAIIALFAALAAVEAQPISSAGSANPCSPQATRGAVQTFVTALHRRDADAADRVFATGESFHWYSTTAPGRRSGRAAYARSTLKRYFAARIARKESLRIKTFRFNGTDGYRHISNFAGILIRAATDLRPTTYRYKGATTCGASDPRLIVWSMAAAKT